MHDSDAAGGAWPGRCGPGQAGSGPADIVRGPAGSALASGGRETGVAAGAVLVGRASEVACPDRRFAQQPVKEARLRVRPVPPQRRAGSRLLERLRQLRGRQLTCAEPGSGARR
ncbi:MAG TPA: hypothetical protein VF070_00500 [Streptosporangiaceae bacterium]